MSTQTKMVTSRGTIYTGDYPITPNLHPIGRPFVILATILSALLIAFMQNETLSSIDTRLQAMALYSCFFLFVIGSLARITIGVPPYKIVTAATTTILGLMLLGFAWTLLAIWFQLPGAPAGIENTRTYFNPGWLFILTVFFLMNIPTIIARYATGIKQLQAELQDGFRK